MPVTEFIASGSLKYYVAVQQVHGFCTTRLIQAKALFHFSEVWEGVDATSILGTRQAQLGVNVKRLTAKDSRNGKASTNHHSRSRSHMFQELAVTRQRNDANVILLQHSLYEATKSQDALAALEDTIERLLPDIVKKPSNDGTVAFYDFATEVQKADAEKLVQEVMECKPPGHHWLYFANATMPDLLSQTPAN